MKDCVFQSGIKKENSPDTEKVMHIKNGRKL